VGELVGGVAQTSDLALVEAEGQVELMIQGSGLMPGAQSVQETPLGRASASWLCHLMLEKQLIETTLHCVQLIEMRLHCVTVGHACAHVLHT
jgi:hypothetical protein